MADLSRERVNNLSLYLLYNRFATEVEDRLDLLSAAARKLGMQPVPVDRDAYDYSDWDKLHVGVTDTFIPVTPFNHELVQVLIARGVTSFFTSPTPFYRAESTTDFDIGLIAEGIPTPRTIVRGTNNRPLLKSYVDHVGGFPLIVKVAGGSMGVGVIKVADWQGLVSTCDYLTKAGTSFQLKEFIPNKGTIRAVVVGDELVCSVLRMNHDDDFRCSSPLLAPKEQLVPANDALTSLALATTRAAGYEFVGIDIVESLDGQYYVLEVNYPHNFVPPQNFTGIDIAHKAVSYLKNKAIRICQGSTDRLR